MNKIRWFLMDYASRHRHPWNRALHVVGVPLAPCLCLFWLLQGQLLAGGAAFAAGYSLQWLGHQLEGNEVGEWILIKKLAGRLTRK
jgi:hypothetical protein